MMDFPEFCLRGVRKQDWITPEGKVTGLAFDPDERTSETRPDGGMETSINWEDDETVLEFSRKQQGFDHGAVRLAREEIDRIKMYPEPTDYLSYERKEIPDNPYHGNIVFRSNLSKKLIRTLAGSLAQRATGIIP